MKKTVLREYARLIVRKGVNVQKGQEVLIYAGLDQPEFVTMVVEEAYKAKAKRVTVEWNLESLTVLHSRYQNVKTLGEVPKWKEMQQEYYCETMPARIHLVSDAPDVLKKANMEKLSKGRQLSYPILKPYIDRRTGRQQWCIAAVPGADWAKKVFPGERTSTAVEKLWEAIITCSRVEEDALAAWDRHNENLKARCRYLNGLQIKSLHYEADNGTNFTVGLIPEADFCAGEEDTREGLPFQPNIPTEECFTSPRRGEAEGIVYSTKPLSYNGTIIDGFSIRFEKGKAVEVHTEVGEEALKSMISMDEGASYLGECALVPQRSPIAEGGLLFYNTLYDENAACHLALGMGFEDVIQDNENKTLEECRALGINDSMIHVDFMIGCDSMNIDATTRDGKVVPIFRNGNWAFEI